MHHPALQFALPLKLTRCTCTLGQVLNRLNRDWKSHFNLKSIPNGNKHYVICMVLAKLLFIVCFQVLYDRLNYFIHNKYQCGISIFKFASLVNSCATWFFSALANNDAKLIASILKVHSTYEKRYNFNNFHQPIAALG